MTFASFAALTSWESEKVKLCFYMSAIKSPVSPNKLSSYLGETRKVQIVILCEMKRRRRGLGGKGDTISFTKSYLVTTRRVHWVLGKLGPRQLGPKKLSWAQLSAPKKWTFGPRGPVVRGPTVRPKKVANLAPDSWAPEICYSKIIKNKHSIKITETNHTS